MLVGLVSLRTKSRRTTELCKEVGLVICRTSGRRTKKRRTSGRRTKKRRTTGIHPFRSRMNITEEKKNMRCNYHY